MEKKSGVYQIRPSKRCKTAGVVTVYGPKLPEGWTVHATQVTAWGNAGSAGELTRVGIEIEGNKNYFHSEVTSAVDDICRMRGSCWAQERQRFFAEFEEANTGEELHLCVNGTWYKEG